MNTELLCLLIVSHFLGDWILQSRKMAINKSKNLGVLITHVLINGITLLPITILLGSWYGLGAYLILHGLQDWFWWRLWSKYLDSKYYESATFYNAIAIDQTIHLILLIVLIF